MGDVQTPLNAHTLILCEMPGNACPETHIAAGPWCFCGQERNFKDWEKNFSFAPEPLADRSLLPKAVHAAQALAVKLVTDIAAWLTHTSGSDVELPESYWQTLLMPWLADLTSQIVERSLRCQAMRKLWGQQELVVPILPPDTSFTFLNEHDFTINGSMGLDFNTWLFSWILQQDWPKKWRCQYLSRPSKETRQPPLENSAWKRALRACLLCLPYPRIKGLSLTRALALSCQLLKPVRGPDYSLDLHKEFSFSEDLASIIPPAWNLKPVWLNALPRSLRNLKHTAVKSSRKPRLKIAHISAAENAAYRQKLARWKAAGNYLGHIQHGGNYGVVQIPCIAELTEYCEQFFFTWGWRKQGLAKGHFVPMPSFHLGKLANKWQPQRDGELIFVGTEMPVYSHRLDCHPTPLQYLAYRQGKKAFFSALPAVIRQKSLYRPYFPLPGTLADADWLLPDFPEIKICSGNLRDKLQHCRLLILDHHGTTLLEAMSMNIPFIAYWDPLAWPVSPEFRQLLTMMLNAGIWFDNPASAAKLTEKVWEETAMWWKRPDIQNIREVFCRQEALFSPHDFSVWKHKLQEITRDHA